MEWECGHQRRTAGLHGLHARDVARHDQFKKNVGRKTAQIRKCGCQRAMRTWLFVNKSRNELESLKNRHLI